MWGFDSSIPSQRHDGRDGPGSNEPGPLSLRCWPGNSGITPSGVAFFEPRLARFAGVLGLARQDLVAVFELQGCLEAYAVDGLVEHLFGEPESERARPTDDALCDGGGCGQQIIGLDDAGDEAHLECLLGLDDAAGVEQVGGVRHADDFGEEVGGANIGATEAEVEVRARKPGVFGADAHIASERNREATTGGRAVDRGDEGLRRLAHFDHEVGYVFLEGERVLDRADARLPGALLGPGLEIEPGTEPTAGASNDDDPSGEITMACIEKGTESAQHCMVDGIEALGAVEGENAKRTAGFEIEGLFHGSAF